MLLIDKVYLLSINPANFSIKIWYPPKFRFHKKCLCWAVLVQTHHFQKSLSLQAGAVGYWGRGSVRDRCHRAALFAARCPTGAMALSPVSPPSPPLLLFLLPLLLLLPLLSPLLSPLLLPLSLLLLLSPLLSL